MPKPYNPVWIKGNVSGDYQRESTSRYLVIASVLSQFNRRFSLFDLGANMGYFSLKACHEFDCVSILADRRPVLPVLRKNALPVIWMDRHFTGKELMQFSQCERFDVALVLNVLHHMNDWQASYRALKGLARYVIFEICGEGDENAKNPELHGPIREAVMEHGQILGEFDSHVSESTRTMVLVDNGPYCLNTRQSMDAKKRGAPKCSVMTTLNFDKASVSIEHETGDEKRPYIPGMNLWNWKLLSGRYPENVETMIKEAQESDHDDGMPWNYLLDGERVIPIDHNNKPRKKKRDFWGTWNDTR